MKLVDTFMPGSKGRPAGPSGIFSDKPPHLFILRHGRIRGAGIKRFIGQIDIPLDETGQTQAQSWAQPFAGLNFDRVYTSELSRCKETAALACPGAKIRVDPRLNEINLGKWEGLSFARVRTSYPDLFDRRGKEIYRFRPPGGESFKDLFNRVSPFFPNLCLTSPTLVVTHAGIIRVMLCHWAGMEMSRIMEIKTAYGQLFALSWAGKTAFPPKSLPI